ncbi:MAG: cytochrome c biogenesis protein CcdA [Candidatus Omnitrophota bacterium]
MIDVSRYLSNISFLTYVFVFAGGVAASFTPCVYPLIPIIVGVIGASKESSRLRNFILSLVYVVGMAITFSILGVIAAMTGKLFGEFQSNPKVYLVVGNVMILFSLAMLDVIPLPTFLLSRAGMGKIVKSGGLLSVFFMGIVSGVIASPCTVAILGVLLAYVAASQNVFLGGSLLFTFAAGIGALLIIIGTFTGLVTAAVKSEKVLKLVQKLFALAMILLGEYFIFKAGILSL